MIGPSDIRRYIGAVVVLAAVEVVVLAMIFMALWRIGDGLDNAIAGVAESQQGCCSCSYGLLEADVSASPTATLAACQVDTATPQLESTATPGVSPTPTERDPQETPTSDPTLGPTPTVPTTTPTPVVTDTTPTVIPSSTPTPEPTATHTPPPTEKPKCNRGLGNGSEGCDPGNSGGKPGGAGEDFE